jgi:hypothetical protein
LQLLDLLRVNVNMRSLSVRLLLKSESSKQNSTHEATRWVALQVYWMIKLKKLFKIFKFEMDLNPRGKLIEPPFMRLEWKHLRNPLNKDQNFLSLKWVFNKRPIFNQLFIRNPRITWDQRLSSSRISVVRRKGRLWGWPITVRL